MRLRNWPVGAGTEGAGPYDSMFLFVIFVTFLRALRGEKTREQGSGCRVKDSFQLPVDSGQESVSFTKFEYWSTGFQAVDRGLTTVDRSTLHPASCVIAPTYTHKTPHCETIPAIP